MILSIDTSTALTSVAVTDGLEVIVERSHLDARKHAEVLAPMLVDVLAHPRVRRAVFEAVACGVGPGPYTGLRVGIASGLAMGLAWTVPVVGLCSLDAIAAAAVDTAALDTAALGVTITAAGFGVASDARRSEVYWARYDSLGRRVEGPLVSRPQAIARPGDIWLGSGAQAHPDVFGVVEFDSEDLTHPHAAWVGRRVHVLLSAGHSPIPADLPLSAHGDDGAGTSSALLGIDLLPARPLYLRRPDAVEARPA